VVIRTLAFGCAWLFILVAATYDASFAWQYRHVIDAWELNPFVSWSARNFGLEAVFVYKFAGLAFALGLAIYCRYRRRRLEKLITMSIGCAYFVLSLHYFVNGLEPAPYPPRPDAALVTSTLSGHHQ
jgi:hypothetical protein